MSQFVKDVVIAGFGWVVSAIVTGYIDKFIQCVSVSAPGNSRRNQN